MSKDDFYAEYERLCKKHKYYLDDPRGLGLRVHSILGPLDRNFEESLIKIAEDIDGGC